MSSPKTPSKIKKIIIHCSPSSVPGPVPPVSQSPAAAPIEEQQIDGLDTHDKTHHLDGDQPAGSPQAGETTAGTTLHEEPDDDSVGMTAENQPSASGSDPAGVPYYEEQRAKLKELLQHKRMIERRLAQTEETIYQRETEYLDSTIHGNIITGFDNYTKGTTAAAAQRRKSGLSDQNRVFSRSSISFKAATNGGNDSATTPGSTPASHAPTPASSTFNHKDTGTPTSAAASHKGGNSGHAHKKKKSTASAVAVAAAAAEDSETDTRETKKVRTNFGAARK